MLAGIAPKPSTCSGLRTGVGQSRSMSPLITEKIRGKFPHSELALRPLEERFAFNGCVRLTTTIILTLAIWFPLGAFIAVLLYAGCSRWIPTDRGRIPGMALEPNERVKARQLHVFPDHKGTMICPQSRIPASGQSPLPEENLP
jgi:hypothetical protein